MLAVFLEGSMLLGLDGDGFVIEGVLCLALPDLRVGEGFAIFISIAFVCGYARSFGDVNTLDQRLERLKLGEDWDRRILNRLDFRLGTRRGGALSDGPSSTSLLMVDKLRGRVTASITMVSSVCAIGD